VTDRSSAGFNDDDDDDDDAMTQPTGLQEQHSIHIRSTIFLAFLKTLASNTPNLDTSTEWLTQKNSNDHRAVRV